MAHHHCSSFDALDLVVVKNMCEVTGDPDADTIIDAFEETMGVINAKIENLHQVFAP